MKNAGQTTAEKKKSTEEAANAALREVKKRENQKSSLPAASAGSKKSSGGSKKSGTGKKAQIEAVPDSSKLIHQFMPYLLGVAAIFLTACFIFGKTDTGTGVVGFGIRNFFCGLFGWPAFFIPLVLLNLAFYWKKYVDLQMVGWKTGLSILTVMSISSVVHSFMISRVRAGEKYPLEDWARSIFGTNGVTSNYKNGASLIGGGFLGGLPGGFVRALCGSIGSPIILIAILVVCVMFFFSITPGYVVTSVRYRLMKLREKRTERREQALIAEEKLKAEAEAIREREQKKAAENAKREAELAERERKRREAEAAREKENARRKAESDAEKAVKTLQNRQGATDLPQAGELDLSELALVSGKVNEKPISSITDNTPAKSPAEEAAANFAARKGRGAKTQETDNGKTSIEILDDVLGGNRRSTSNAGIGARDVAAAISAERNAAAASQAASQAPSFELHTNEQPAESKGNDTVILLPPSAATPAKEEKPAAKTNDTPSRPAGSNTIPVSQPVATKAPDASELLDKMAEVGTEELSEDITGVAEGSDTDAAKRNAKRLSVYFFPPTDLLKEPEIPCQDDIAAELRGNAQAIMNKLAAFNVKIRKIDYSRGPTITRYELYPEASTRVRSIASLSDDIALELAATIRMEAPIPNKNAVGVEVPNQVRATVFIRDLIESEKFKGMTSKLSACLGKDVGGNMVFFDIGKMPHLLVAGTTGSGKSVCINTIILSLLYKARPDEVKFIMIDPKKIEMGMYNGLPHMKVPVVTDMKRAAGTLNAAVNEMEHRYTLFEECNARDIDGYNKLMSEGDPDFIPLPRLVIIIDELADLMMSSPTEIETAIIRIAQKARAAGIHLIIGTQRPSANVITGLIKANVPSRIAFSVVSNVDSRIIIDVAGAEKLIGKGDMLFSPIGSPKPARIQGAFVADDEVRRVTDWIKANSEEVEYDEEFISKIDHETDLLTADENGKKGGSGDEDVSEFSQDADKLFNQALHIAVDNGSIATSLLQRKLSIGFGRGAKIIDRMEALGFVSGANGTKPRNVLIDKQQLMELEMAHDPRTEGRFN